MLLGEGEIFVVGALFCALATEILPNNAATVAIAIRDFIVFGSAVQTKPRHSYNEHRRDRVPRKSFPFVLRCDSPVPDPSELDRIALSSLV